jgi:hypothetical protein
LNDELFRLCGLLVEKKLLCAAPDSSYALESRLESPPGAGTEALLICVCYNRS